MPKVINALLGRKRLDEPADQLPERTDGAGGTLRIAVPQRQSRTASAHSDAL